MYKSQIVGLILTLLLGPIGLFYSSASAALMLIAIAIVIALITSGIGAIVIWPISILVGIITVYRYNRKTAFYEKRYDEITKAVKLVG